MSQSYLLAKFVFFAFFWYFRGIFSIACRRGNLYFGLVFLAYFGVCGVFCSVAGSWVVKTSGWKARGRLSEEFFAVFGPEGIEIAVDGRQSLRVGPSKVATNVHGT